MKNDEYNEIFQLQIFGEDITSIFWNFKIHVDFFFYM